MQKQFFEIKANPELFEELFFAAGGEADNLPYARALFNEQIVSQTFDTSFLYLSISRFAKNHILFQINNLKKLRNSTMKPIKPYGDDLLPGFMAVGGVMIVSALTALYDLNVYVGSLGLVVAMYATDISVSGLKNDIIYGWKMRSSQRNLKVEGIFNFNHLIRATVLDGVKVEEE